ncbi:centrosomal protein of 135 kDa [Topomyia yanbarensis]|uniref:centrosomal protein of 135 kDa n=1 Tax=Topomyia yanbarensis TaxID=2498891 RepID=UPI00273AD0E3|nr:centrosomal protein of 135 kDa [Topomyia yanbarensis]
MDLDALHSDLRKRLDVLGFNHPLPLGAIGIVSAILDDLIKTSEKLKAARQQIQQLQQEKVAWDLGVEPYKCDNSRLLAECNGLHLELVKQRDKFVLANTELKCRVRNLQTDKKQLEERCLQAETKIRELQSADWKSKKDGVNMQRKPFVSTVRPGYYQPPKCCDSQQPKNRCECPCNQPRKTEIMHEIERLQVETKNQTEVIEAYKKQIDYRDREIQRLGALFAGGRPTTALAKDCCYRSVNSLAEDVGKLQEEKVSIQNKLTDAWESQQNASKKIQKLSERNKQLEQELKEIENVALNVESEANLHILDRDRHNSDLQIQLHQSNMRIKELETILEAKSVALTPSSSLASASSMDSVLQNALKQASEEKRALYKQLNELKQREQTFLNDYEKIKTKYSKLKLKLSSQTVHSKENNQDCTELVEMKQKLEDSLNNVKSERDQLSNELKSLRDTNTKLRNEATEKDVRIAQLESEAHLQKKTSTANAGRLRTADSAISAQSSLSVQSAFHRVERERDAAKREAQQLEIERDSLRNKLQLATKSQIDEQTKREEVIISYSSQIAKLEAEKRDLLCGQNSSQTSLHLLREENRELQERLKDVENGFSKLRVSHSQLKMLHEQTERALAQQQNRLMCSENQLGSAEAKLNQVDGTIESATKDIGKLKGDISVLKASNASLQREKDKLLMELDKKTEKLYTVETELSKVKSNTTEMGNTIDRLQKKLENASVDNIHKESTLRNVTSESDTLKKQVATLKRSHDNAVAENGRLSGELSDAVSEHTLTKRKLAECQQEVERMKSQLREYVQEIQRAEDLLCIKEKEREEMLEHYKSLSDGVNMLEVSNHTLEVESAEAKKLLQEAEDRVSRLQEQVELRQSEIRTYERQINDLSASIISLEEEIECIKEENANLRQDLEATKDLCSKLDLQKDRLKEELNEHSTIREQLNKENDTLKRQLSLAKTGDKAAVDGLQELLAASRSEVEQQRIITGQLNKEVNSLKARVEELTKKLTIERDNSKRNEALANEYSVQLQELRRMITDDRFAQVQSREDDDYNRMKIYLDTAETGLKLDNVLKLDESHSSEFLSNSIISEIPEPLEPLALALNCLDVRNENLSIPRTICSESYLNIVERIVQKGQTGFSEPETLEILDRYQIRSRGSQFAKRDSSVINTVEEKSHEPMNNQFTDGAGLIITEKSSEEKRKNVGLPNRSELVESHLEQTNSGSDTSYVTSNSFEHSKSQGNLNNKTNYSEEKMSSTTCQKIPIIKVEDETSNLLNEKKKLVENKTTQRSTKQPKAPKGWRISQYARKESSSKPSQVSSSTSERDSLKKNASDQQKSSSGAEAQDSKLKTSLPKREKVAKRNSFTSSPVKRTSVVDLVTHAPSDSVIRDNSNRDGTIPEIESIVEPKPMLSRNESCMNLRSSFTLDKGDEPSMFQLPNHHEMSYEQFRQSFRKRPSTGADSTRANSSALEQQDLSMSSPVPKIVNRRSPVKSNHSKKASNTSISRKEPGGCAQLTTGKNNGGGSIAIVYKNALGDRFILADDKQDNGPDCTTARGSIMVIDDLRRPKMPIRTPKASAGKASSSATRLRKDIQQTPTGRRSNESITTTFGSGRCEQRKWGEILQRNPSPSRRQQTNENRVSSLSGITNDRITTINYEILNTRGERSSGSVEAVEVIQSGQMPPRLQPITSTDNGAGLAPEVQLSGDSKMYVLNFKIKVPADNGKGTEQAKN